MTPLDRFTESARRSLFFARLAVSTHGGQAIRDGHLALGVVEAAPEALSRLNAARDAVASVEECLRAQLASEERLATSTEVPFDDGAEKILERAAATADARGHHGITPEHLLLAILGLDGEAAACFRQVGIDAVAVESLLLPRKP